MQEDHRFFPEWADRPASAGSFHEADRNSYLAGGYAEEFGHRVSAALVRAVATPLEGDFEWRVHIGCLHPGYPECPRPLDRGALARGTGEAPAETTAAKTAVRRKSPAGYDVLRVFWQTPDRRRGRLALAWRRSLMRRHRFPTN